MSDGRRVAIVVPVEEELAPYRTLVSGFRTVPACRPWEAYEGTLGETRVALILSDCGPANAAAATERVLGGFSPGLVLHGGAAGAHDPALLPGDVVVGARYSILFPPEAQQRVEEDGKLVFRKGFRFRKNGARVHFPVARTTPALLKLAVRSARRLAPGFGTWTAPGWPAGVAPRRARVVAGLVGSTDAWTRDAARLAALSALYRARCEDMESAWVAQVCALHDVPFLAVRVISNADAARPLAEEEVAASLAEAGRRAAAVLADVARDAPLRGSGSPGESGRGDRGDESRGHEGWGQA